MKDTLATLGRYALKISLIVGIFSVFATTFASIPNAGTLYEKWIQEIFISPPTGENGLKETLSNSTVKRSHALVDQTGKEVAWGLEGPNGEKKLVIGDKSINTQTLTIEGPEAAMKISATSGNPELSLGETDGNHGSIYHNSASNELTLWNQNNSMTISSEKTNFPNGAQAKEKKIISVFTCPDGEFLQGFDADANPLCASGSGDNYIWVSHPTASCSVQCGGGTAPYAVKCRSNNNAFTIVEESFCDATKKPSLEARECNVQVCPLPLHEG